MGAVRLKRRVKVKLSDHTARPHKKGRSESCPSGQVEIRTENMIDTFLRFAVSFPKESFDHERNTPMASNDMQRTRLLAHLEARGFARAKELRHIGIAATAISRAVDAGLVDRVGRGLYRLPECTPDQRHCLAEVAKCAPRAVICLKSALLFHGVTDVRPDAIWIAIGYKDWAPRIKHTPIRIVRFRDDHLRNDVETHDVAGERVRVYSLAKTIVDAFRLPRHVERSTVIAATKVALYEGRKTPGEIAETAIENGVWPTVKPYLEAMIADD